MKNLALVLFLLCLPLAAQEPARLPTVDRVLVAGVFAARMNDAASTRWAVEHGWLERNLPVPLSESTPGMVSYGLGASYAQLILSRYLVRHRMRWLATGTEILHIGYAVYCGAGNWAAR